jgi:hypothetical protein
MQPGGAQEWIDLFRSLGQALLDVLRAEAQALGADFRLSGERLARALALLGAAAAVSFWTLGVLLAALVALLAIWLPVWGAALAVAGLFALAAALLAAAGWRQMRQLGNPADDIRRRFADHLDWWQDRLLAGPAPLAADGRANAGLPRTPPPPTTRGPATIHPDDPLESGFEEDEP